MILGEALRSSPTVDTAIPVKNLQIFPLCPRECRYACSAFNRITALGMLNIALWMGLPISLCCSLDVLSIPSIRRTLEGAYMVTVSTSAIDIERVIRAT